MTMRVVGVAWVLLLTCLDHASLGPSGHVELAVVDHDDQDVVDVDALQEPPCGQPESIAHGLTDWDGRGSVARYACFQGYHLVGPAYVECRYGQWYSKATVSPSCQPIFCNEANIEHGNIVKQEGRRSVRLNSS